MKYGYKTTMQGGKNISQRDAYAGAMQSAIKGTKVFGLIKGAGRMKNQSLGKGRKNVFKNTSR